MKTFIGIGSNHFLDVYDKITSILEFHKPEAVQHKIFMPKKNFKKSTPVIIQENGHVRIFQLGEEVIPNHNHSPLEPLAGIGYATQHNLPLYFLGWNPYIPNTIVKIHSGKAKLVELNKDSRYKLEFPKDKDFTSYQGRLIIHSERKIDLLNTFMADAINLLYEEFDTIAHIGGAGHFDSSYPEEKDVNTREIFYTSPGKEIQNLVHTNDNFVYDITPEKANATHFGKIYKEIM